MHNNLGGGGGTPNFLSCSLKHLTNRNGFGLTSIIIAVVALGAIMVPVTKWIVSMSNDTEELSTKLEMQSYIQDYWQKVNAATYDEFQEEISTKGTTWTEDVGGKFELTIKFSADGKYQNATCYVGTAAGTEDRHCRKAEISIVSKENTSLAQGLETTKISSAAESRRLREMEEKIANNTNKIANNTNSISSLSSSVSKQISNLSANFLNYYTKSQTYSKSEVDAKIGSSGNSGDGCQNRYYLVGSCDDSMYCPWGTGDKTFTSVSAAVSYYRSAGTGVDTSCVQEVVCAGTVVKRTSLWWLRIYTLKAVNNELASKTCG